VINPEFLLASLVVVLIPGTGVIYTITTGLTLKWRASIAAAIGCTLGIVPHILASILGLSALLNVSAQVFSALKIAGAMYLLTSPGICGVKQAPWKSIKKAQDPASHRS